MNPFFLIMLIAIAFAIIFALQTLSLRKRVSGEEKVMKGYFLLGLSGLMAKIAQADGVVTISESEMAQRFIAKMNLTDAEKAMCFGNFISARTDGLEPRDHAKRFMAYANPIACEFLYDLLWRISRVDGVLAESEDAMLKELARDLGVSESLYQQLKNGERHRYDPAALRAAGVPASLLTLAGD